MKILDSDVLIHDLSERYDFIIIKGLSLSLK